MAKKTKDNTIDLLYINKKDTTNSKKKTTKKKINNNVPKKVMPEKDIINLDNEVIIGLTPKPKQKQPQKQKVDKKMPNKKTPPKKVAKKNNLSPKTIIKLKILKWTSICVLLVAVTILLMLSPIFNVKQINVEGNSKLSKEEIIGLSQIQLDTNTFKISKKEVANKIRTNSYIDTVNVSRELPNTIKITVKERIPQYSIQIANGNVYIDSMGYILEISKEQLQLPMIIGYNTSLENIIDFENTKKLSDEDCQKIELINQIVEAAKNNDMLNYITSIDISDTNDIKLNLEGEKKTAHFGDASNANLRILYLKRIIEEEVGKEGDAFINGDLNTLKPKPYFREKV